VHPNDILALSNTPSLSEILATFEQNWDACIKSSFAIATGSYNRLRYEHDEGIPYIGNTFDSSSCCTKCAATAHAVFVI
jgi:hypothetical protein